MTEITIPEGIIVPRKGVKLRKIVLVGGEPAAGKTTLVRRVLKEIGYRGTRFHWGLVDGTFDAAHHLVVLGSYPEGKVFAGTDTLSMAVAPAAVRFLESLGPFEGFTLLLEGDRLFNRTFIAGAKAHCPLEVYVLKCSPDVLAERHRLRADGQKESWLAGRRTKVESLAAETGAVILPNNEPSDQAAALKILLAALK